METITNTGAAISAAHLSLLKLLKDPETSMMYCDVLSEVSTYIIMSDDPDLPSEKLLHWARTLSMIIMDITALTKSL